jgi:hypothetical protein
MKPIKVETQDIVLAATLKVLGFKLSRIDKVGNKGTFVFDDVQESIVNDFYVGRCCVEPVAFNSSIKALTTATRRML